MALVFCYHKSPILNLTKSTSSFLTMHARTVLLTFFLFSICFTNSFFPASAADENDQEQQLPEAVFDTDGNKLQAGVKYYVLPLTRGSGGGLTFTSFSNQTCTDLSVVQEQLEVDPGNSITFRPAAKEEGVIRVSTDLNFIFSAFTICIQSNVWKLDYDESINRYVININGVSGNPGKETISNWFKIEKYQQIGDHYYYKIRFCPTVCDYCKVVCKDVGIFFQEDEDKKEWRRLVLTDEKPFRVMFKKVPSTSSTSF